MIDAILWLILTIGIPWAIYLASHSFRWTLLAFASVIAILLFLEYLGRRCHHKLIRKWARKQKLPIISIRIEPPFDINVRGPGVWKWTPVTYEVKVQSPDGSLGAYNVMFLGTLFNFLVHDSSFDPRPVHPFEQPFKPS